MALSSEKVLKGGERSFLCWILQTIKHWYVKYVAHKKTNFVQCQTWVWVSYLKALTIDCLL